MAQLLEINNISKNPMVTDAKKTCTPKFSYQELVNACQNGQAKTIKDFCQERYESREEKRRLCYELIQTAKKYNQEEIVAMLQYQYDHQLKLDIPSDIELDKIVTLDANYRKMLPALLGSLNQIITGISADLDPADPKTYLDLFSKLTSNVRQRSQDLGNTKTNGDVKKLIQKEITDSDKKLATIEDKLNQLQKYNETLMENIRETDERLSSAQGLAAIERKKIFDEQELHKKQLAVYESSMQLFLREQESLLNRCKTIKFIKKNTNLFLFYRTVENRLQALFQSVLAAQGGYLQTTMNVKYKVAGSAAGPVAHAVVSKALNLLSIFRK